MKTLGKAISHAWRGLDWTRRALLNLIVLLVLGAALWWLVKPGQPALKDNTLLVLKLSGDLVEQFSGSARTRATAMLRGGSQPQQLRLRDVLQVLDAVAKDTKITHVLLDVDDLGSAGLASLREVAQGIERVKAAGKRVTAWGEGYTQGQYFLAAHAGEVFLHPMGHVAVEGYGRHRVYYKDLFDRLGVQAHVVRAGRYKNFAEPYAANAPSAETLESSRSLYGALWGVYTEGVEKARKQPRGSLAAGIERLPQAMTEAGGDIAKLALASRLVDGLKTEDELREHLLKAGAAPADDTKKGAAGDKATTPDIRRVSFGSYLARIKPKSDGDAIGVVVAEGNIVDGEAGPGTVGGRSTAALIRSAREDDKIKALVLRVRSPGGSAFASEQVRRELELARKAGKPVVVSMGDVAASGGYWISQSADEVFADPATITGSIGVVGMLPSVEGAMAKLGLKTGGVSTTWLGDGYDPRRGLDPRFEKLVQQAIDHAYVDFIGKVAAARKTTPEKIDAVAQGRVWTGAQARELGLIDHLGSFGDAVKAAAQRAKLGDDPRVVYVEKSGGRLDRLLASFVTWVAAQAGEGALADSLTDPAGPLGTALGALEPEWADFAELASLLHQAGSAQRGIPRALAHCGCTSGL